MTDSPKTATGMQWEEDSQPRGFAIRLMRERFGGPIPEMVTSGECLELMLKFAEFETALANSYEKMARAVTALLPPKPVIIEKKAEK